MCITPLMLLAPPPTYVLDIILLILRLVLISALNLYLDMFDDKLASFSRTSTSSAALAGALVDLTRAALLGPDSLLMLLPDPVRAD